MLPVATWLELKGIMLSEISQTEKGDYHMISLICGIYKTNKNLLNTENSWWLPEVESEEWAKWVKGTKDTNFQL